MYLRGIATEVQPWVVILDAANGDPLRAQEIENQLSQFWWERYLLHRKEQSLVDQEEKRKNERSISRGRR